MLMKQQLIEASAQYYDGLISAREFQYRVLTILANDKWGEDEMVWLAKALASND